MVVEERYIYCCKSPNKLLLLVFPREKDALFHRGIPRWLLIGAVVIFSSRQKVSKDS